MQLRAIPTLSGTIYRTREAGRFGTLAPEWTGEVWELRTTTVVSPSGADVDPEGELGGDERAARLVSASLLTATDAAFYTEEAEAAAAAAELLAAYSAAEVDATPEDRAAMERCVRRTETTVEYRVEGASTALWSARAEVSRAR